MTPHKSCPFALNGGKWGIDEEGKNGWTYRVHSCVENSCMAWDESYGCRLIPPAPLPFLLKGEEP